MAIVTCSRCGRTTEGLARAPHSGKLGQDILAHVCPACWAEWQQAAPSYINHYGLQVVQPAGRARLYELMREYLNIPAEA